MGSHSRQRFSSAPHLVPWDRPALRRGALLASVWGGAVVLGLAGSFALFGGPVIDIMTNTEAVQVEARRYLPFMVAAPLIGGPAWMLDGIFIGATQSRDMRNMMAISAAVYAISVMILVPQFANNGLWISFLISFACARDHFGSALSVA